jgi:hypothetical protein
MVKNKMAVKLFFERVYIPLLDRFIVAWPWSERIRECEDFNPTVHCKYGCTITTPRVELRAAWWEFVLF